MRLYRAIVVCGVVWCACVQSVLMCTDVQVNKSEAAKAVQARVCRVLPTYKVLMSFNASSQGCIEATLVQAAALRPRFKAIWYHLAFY